jgi:hypothetical protein
MKSSILRAGVVAAACALGLSACGGGSGDLVLGGAVSGVTKDGLVLQNNGGDDLVIRAGDSSFQFANRVSTDDQFNITVKTSPPNAEKCSVFNGSARANVWSIGQISVSCTIKTHTLTVAIQGLKATSTGLILVNGSDKQEVPAGATSVAMAKIYEGNPYAITVFQNPKDPASGTTTQTCEVSGGDTGTGTGIMNDVDLNGKVVVTCK